MKGRDFLVVLLIVSIGGMLGGCVEITTQAINRYQAAESKVNLGDSKEEVLAILQPTQENLSGTLKRAPEHWVDPKSGKTVDLYYFRSGWVQDGRLTDDEFTPYLFVENILVAIGWNALRSLAIQPQVDSKKIESSLDANGKEIQLKKESGLLTDPSGETFLNSVTPNAYGPGINSDATGRPFTYQPEFGSGGGQLKVKPNAYGPGIGLDQYGRPVRAQPWP